MHLPTSSTELSSWVMNLSGKTATPTSVWVGVVFPFLSNIARRQTHFPNNFYWVRHSWGGGGRGSLNRVPMMSCSPWTWDTCVGVYTEGFLCWIYSALRCLCVLSWFISWWYFVRWMPSSSEHRCRRRWLITKSERSLACLWRWEWRMCKATGWQIHKQWRSIVGYIRRCSLRPVWWGISLIDCRRRVIWEQLMELLLQDGHVVMLLLKLWIALIEALQYLILLLHVALLIKEALESLIGFLLPLLILLKRVATYNEHGQ